jgi:predicted RNA-binding Zn ribbon-like protein
MLDTAQLALDFSSAPLTDADDFAAWITSNGLLSASPPVGDTQREDATILRDAISRAMRAIASGDPIPTREGATLNSFADEDPPRLALRLDGTIARTATTPIPAVLSAIARVAIDLLVSRAADLRICESEGCGQVFLDDSRGHRRRWCSMTRCGNRAKATAFRERRNDRAQRTTRP